MATPGGLLLLPLLLQLLLLAGSSSAVTRDQELPNEVCSIDNTTCAIDENIVQIIPEVLDLQECRRLCQDETTCEYLTYFGPDSYPLSNMCILFSSCSDLEECTHCTTEAGGCVHLEAMALCSGSVESHIVDNLINILPDVSDEQGCKGHCSSTNGCNFYTYFLGDTSTFPETCFLLSELRDPMHVCKDCSTGPADCLGREGCLFMDDVGNTSSKLLLTATSQPVALGLGLCQLGVLAVGGGGTGGGGGGGSGYVHHTQQVVTGTAHLQVTVGPAGQRSTVWLEGEVLLEAESGGDGDGYTGGDGYCGGGGSGHNGGGGGGDGGSDGSDGASGVFAGGRGGHVDVGSILVTGFAVTPARGGTAYGYSGGGAGGLLVDGEGPTTDADDHDGKGFGAGSNNGAGAQAGVVIMSFV